jgi:hypothetical protein
MVPKLPPGDEVVERVTRRYARAWAPTAERWTAKNRPPVTQPRPPVALIPPRCAEDAAFVVDAWNTRLARRMPLLFSPSIGAALASGIARARAAR